MEKQYCLGIDLGTTNSAMAVTREDRIEVVAVTQLVAAGRISEKETLASALFVPPEAERGRAFELPWESGEPPDYAVGHLARDRGATLPDRLVVSAKSWLCNHHVDRQEPVLPWQSEIKEKRSPFEASRLFLEHLKNAFIFHGENRDASFSLDACDVVLTVPASFDEVARSLTHEAAEQAGLGRVVLLEEPLAAFYAWIDQAGAAWRDFVEPGDVVLVVDVGGGTADFTLVAISETDGDL
ncbi:MAG: Hsp70 family protein, partial [Deltaproteobacteria bacterium]|nr:Hsp70 family protein [Deltaproteobacteria bacterium]